MEFLPNDAKNILPTATLSPHWNVSTTNAWIVIKFGTDIHGPLGMNPDILAIPWLFIHFSNTHNQ